MSAVRQPTKQPGYYHGAVVRPATAHAAGGPVVTGRRFDVDDLSGVAWQELRAIAKLVGVPGYAKMKRPALEAAVRSAQEATRRVG